MTARRAILYTVKRPKSELLKISRLLRLLSTGLIETTFLDAGSTVKMAEFCLSLVKDSATRPSSLHFKMESVCLG